MNHIAWTPLTDTFDYTMQGLEAGLLVRHIATFDLRTCSIDDSVVAVLGDPALADFDQIAVRDNSGYVVGVLGRTTESESVADKVSDRMQRLDESVLVPAGAPLMSFIRLAGTAPYRLVLTEQGIEGIVTRSDLLKLPVRLLAFAFVTHLETLMAGVIATQYRPDDERWLQLLSEGRRQKIADKRETLKRRRLEPALLELTDFCDKRDVVKETVALEASFDADMRDIEHLRNVLAHGGTFVRSDAEARALAEQIERAEKWIGALRKVIADRAGE